MAMRVTHNVMSNRLLQDLRAGYGRLSETQSQISSGKRIHKPSDDPLAAGQARLRKVDLEAVDRFRAGADQSTSRLQATDTALGHLTDILTRAKELAVQGGNGSLNAIDRLRIADEIDQLANSAKDAVSVRVGDAYIFSGQATTTAPYATATGDAFQGDPAGTIVRDVGPGVAVQLNPSVPTVPSGTATLSGRALLGDGTTANDGRILDAL
ncbi:MAG: flagellar hook-associated protein FlgL, partial [Solirubrobacterales bacterium]|nr:flagellar hook-associated protein FlgL [Solirubrobacterales bacterium]